MNNNKDQIFKFLTGTLPKKYYNEFVKELQNSKEMQEEFLKESNFEALLYSQQWTANNLNETSIFDSFYPTPTISTMEYKTLLPKKSNTVLFSLRFVYNIAAILILSLTLIFTFLHFNSNNDIKLANSSIQDSVKVKTIVKKHLITNTSQPSRNQNTEVLKIKDNFKFNKIKLSKNASYIKKKLSNFEILKNNDSIAIIHLQKGEMQFFVKTGSYKKFAVITNHAEIRVTGTIFSISTDEITTNATVYKGSVLITDKSGTQTSLDANSSKTLKITPTGIDEIELLNVLNFDTSKSFLKEFLSQYDNKSIMSTAADSTLTTINNHSLKILKELNKFDSPEIEAQKMHLNAVQKFISQNNFNNAKKSLIKLLNDDIDEIIRQLTLIMLGKLYYQNAPELFTNEFREIINEHQEYSFTKDFLLLMIFTEKNTYNTHNFYKHSEEFITLFPNNKHNDVLYWYLSQRDLNKNDYDLAIEKLENIINKYPESQFVVDAKYWLGWCLINRPKKFSGLK